MKLEADKLRTVLLEVETILPNTTEDGRNFVEDITNKHGFDRNELIEYLLILREANLIRATFNSMDQIGGKLPGSIGGLTYNGHEFINKVRDNRVWDKVKNFLNSTGTGVSIEVIKNVATKALESII
ncbi:MAG TPA: hypothetical protein DCL80_15420 [Balneola sp.]|nr:hypothetical protein [Balneola sp.]MAO78913.1 hypothetical protein [Balneola sp.]MBF63572.1 hypothetical protein [Balneola sp.]HAH52563.1 hypothetical protein [Balneola sp.]HAW81391.1 hypothetical protein [Balneola sp.]|tara:strand:- start:3541 stop:3921 length:381 start_codon:yes stop_codon:yes gene_type:complete